jgi:hypothetical protein
MLSVNCPKCGRALKTPEHAYGRQVRCKTCRHQFRLEPVIPAVTAVEPRPGEAIMESVPGIAQPGPTPVFDNGPPPRPPDPFRAFRRLIPAEQRTWIIRIGGILLVVAGGAALAFFLTRSKDGKYGKYGGIEIGSTGIKMVVADFFSQGDSWNYTALEKESDNAAKLGDALAPGNSAAEDESLAKALAKIREYFETIHGKHGVPAERIYVICSSGLFSKLEGQAKYEKQEKLQRLVKESIGKIMVPLDEAEEAKDSLLVCAPRPEERSDSLLISITGGNTKGGYFDNDNIFKSMTFPYGTKTYEKKVNQRPNNEGFSQAAHRLAAELLIPAINEGLRDDPGLNRRRKIYLLGGIVWAMCTYTHPNQAADLRVRLLASDIKDFRARAGYKQPGQLAEAAMDLVEADKKEAAAKELAEVGKVFKDERQLIAGAEILAALAAKYDFGGKDLVFFRDGQYAWTIGYIVKKVGIEK